MAIITTSFALDEIRGQAGGVTFSSGLGGPYIKTPSGMLPPPTERQLEIQETLSSLSAGFTALTDEQKEAWAEFSKTNLFTNSLGEKVKGNAISSFVQINSNRMLLCDDAAPSSLTSPPAIMSPPELKKPATPVLNIGATSVEFTFPKNLAVSTDVYYTCRVSPALNPGVTSIQQPTVLLNSIKKISGSATPTLIFDIQGMDAAYNLVAGNRVVVHVQACKYTNGQVSPMYAFFVTVVEV
jgi:hypothetical protein